MKKKLKLRKVETKNLVEELTDGPFHSVTESSIDIKNRIIRKVCVFGKRKSENDRIYKDRAIESIYNKSEGLKMFINHPSKTELKERDGVRDLRDWGGVYRNPEREGDKVYADLYVREAYFPLVKDIAIMQPEKIGTSINARVKMFISDDGMESVADVDLLRSGDLVASAATTQNLFESAIEENINEEFNILSDTTEGRVEDKLKIVMAEEGIIQKHLDNREIRRTISDVTYTANELIERILYDGKLSITDKKKKVIEVYDDLESEIKSKLKGIKETKKMLTLESLKNDNPELVAAIVAEAQGKADCEGVKEELKATQESLEKAEKKIGTLETSVEEKTSEVEKLEQSNLELKNKLDEKEVSEKMAGKKAMISEMLTEAKLPKEAKTEIFMETLMQLEEKTVEKDGEEVPLTVKEQATAHIEERKNLINKGTGKIKGSGEEFDLNLEEEEGDTKTIEESTKEFEKDLKS